MLAAVSDPEARPTGPGNHRRGDTILSDTRQSLSRLDYEKGN
jgi:hypothetical protein